MLTQKDFIALADALRKTRPIEAEHEPDCYAACYSTWENIRDSIADICANSNARFDRKRWTDYIAGVRTGGVKARRTTGGVK